ncbi:ALBINO3-like protein 2, chloroplastic isoform X2 [Pyrus communis]|uniref:ALBINO3-like protein 2, chloroplastic isoform X2 n=1 Tax=Pyrus communis TaxID=23211 RepID=UPI0035C03BAE
MALAHHLLRRSRASAVFNFQLMIPTLSAAQPHARQSHLPLPLILPFAPTRTFSSHTPCLDRLGLGVVPAESAATQSTGVLNSGAEKSLLPIDELISVLDWFHQLTGLPWWVVIASSTLAMKITVLPIRMLQINKLTRIARLLPKLPPPLPPPFSGKSYMGQMSRFYKKSKAVGCPSFLWILAYPIVYAPCFILWLNTTRNMSLDNHPGFDSGGTLWFQNLTETPHSVLGLVLPFMIAGLHFASVQISFPTVGERTDMHGLMGKYYKDYLVFLTVPILCVSCTMPQGSLVFWGTSSLLNIIQKLTLDNPAVRAKLRFPGIDAPTGAANSKDLSTREISPLASPTRMKTINLHNLSPIELLNLSVLVLSRGDTDRALHMKKLALEKDPENVKALITTGQTLLKKTLNAEATEYFERALTKLFSAGRPTGAEDVDLLIIASQWTGVAYIRQVREKLRKGWYTLKELQKWKCQMNQEAKLITMTLYYCFQAFWPKWIARLKL